MKSVPTVFSKLSPLFLSFAALFAICGVLFDSWAVKSVATDGFRRIVVSRGLWSITLDNQYGVAVSASYYTADQNGDIVDPFCGTSSAVSIFQQYMPLLASVPSYPASPTYLKNGTCCDEASFYSRGRDFDIGDWCALRRAAGGCSLVTAGALLAAAAVCIFTRARNLTMLPTAILSLLAAAMGIATTAIYGVWFFHEQDHIHDSVLHDSISAERGGASLCLFIVAFCMAFAAGGNELFMICSGRERAAPLPPMPGTVPLLDEKSVHGHRRRYDTAPAYK